MNAVTAFLDLSAIYGSALNETEFLRSGKLKVINQSDAQNATKAAQ